MPRSVKISIYAVDIPPAPATISIRLKYAQQEPPFWYKPEKMVIVSGFPGSFIQTAEQLMTLGVIDKSYRWAYGDGHLVIVGNCLDGSEESVRLLWYLYGLESSAFKSGGHLHFLPGAIEEKLINGSWRQAPPPYAPKAVNAASQYTILFDGNQELYRWLLSKNLHLKIGNIAVVQCGRERSVVWPLKSTGSGIDWPILEKQPAEISSAEIKGLRKKLLVQTLMLVDSATGTVMFYRGSKNESLHSVLPIIREQERWFFPNLKDHHINPGNENFPG